MICPKCHTLGELKQFTSFSYYYCQTCKDEIGASASYAKDGSSALSEDQQKDRLLNKGWTKLTFFKTHYWTKSPNNYPTFNFEEAVEIQDLIDSGKSWEDAVKEVLDAQQMSFPWYSP